MVRRLQSTLEIVTKVAQDSISDGKKLLAMQNEVLGWMSKILTFVALKIFNGKIKSVVKKSGDEIEVTCTIEIRGVDFVGKASKTGNSQQEVDAMKREAASEAHEIAFEKFVEANDDGKPYRPQYEAMPEADEEIGEEDSDLD